MVVVPPVTARPAGDSQELSWLGWWCLVVVVVGVVVVVVARIDRYPRGGLMT